MRRGEDRLDALVVEWFQVDDNAESAHARAQLERVAGIGAHGCDDRDDRTELAQHGQRVGVAPLQVVDHEHSVLEGPAGNRDDHDRLAYELAAQRGRGGRSRAPRPGARTLVRRRPAGPHGQCGLEHRGLADARLAVDQTAHTVGDRGRERLDLGLTPVEKR